MYKKALEFATKKHAGHKRRNGYNYIIHPIRVSQEVNTIRQKVIALLHDTLEDTETTYEELEREFGVEVADSVLALTHHENQPYEKYIEQVKMNQDAIAVKIADIADNLSDAPSDKAIKRSSAAIAILLTYTSPSSKEEPKNIEK